MIETRHTFHKLRNGILKTTYNNLTTVLKLVGALTRKLNIKSHDHVCARAPLFK